MIETVQAVELKNGEVLCATETKQLCAACGYDLDAAELKAATCSDCGAPLTVAQHVAIHATSVPAVAVTFE